MNNPEPLLPDAIVDKLTALAFYLNTYTNRIEIIDDVFLHRGKHYKVMTNDEADSFVQQIIQLELDDNVYSQIMPMYRDFFNEALYIDIQIQQNGRGFYLAKDGKERVVEYENTIYYIYLIG